MRTPRKGGFVHILYWILGINLVMVVVGLLAFYILDELVARPRWLRAYGYKAHEPRPISEYLEHRFCRNATPMRKLLLFLGPSIILDFIHYALLVKEVRGMGGHLVFTMVLFRKTPQNHTAGHVNLDDTQELPQGFQNT